MYEENPIPNEFFEKIESSNPKLTVDFNFSSENLLAISNPTRVQAGARRLCALIRYEMDFNKKGPRITMSEQDRKFLEKDYHGEDKFMIALKRIVLEDEDPQEALKKTPPDRIYVEAFREYCRKRESRISESQALARLDIISGTKAEGSGNNNDLGDVCDRFLDYTGCSS